MDLEEFKLGWECLEAPLRPPFYFLIDASAAERTLNKQLVREYRDGISVPHLIGWWRSIGTLVGGMTEGHIRMMGPEVNGGFVFEPLGGDMERKECISSRWAQGRQQSRSSRK